MSVLLAPRRKSAHPSENDTATHSKIHLKSLFYIEKIRLSWSYHYIMDRKKTLSSPTLALNLFILLLSQFQIDCSHEPEQSHRHLRGVHPDRLAYYQSLLKEARFQCIDGSSSIPIESLNDNYCDCADGSDEPSTSACPNGQFFCQNQGYLSKLIPSAWVNDNRCDCCDASDEYDSDANCENSCDNLGTEYRREMELQRQISDRGSEIRSQYKLNARLRKEQNNELIQTYKREITEKSEEIKRLEEEINSDYGPSSVFLTLKQKCFTHKDREYTYTLCLFEKATQESTHGLHTELGRYAGWSGPQQDPYSSQKYEGGGQCWNGPTRSALVNIKCGIEDKIVSVTEPSKCEYVFDFLTPAACPDTDPPEPSPEPQQPDSGQPTHETEEEATYPDNLSDHLSDDQIEAPEGGSLSPDDGVHDEL